MASIHDKLEKIQKPRVHIKYDIETENGTVEKTLPFVVGVMGDFAGNDPGVAQKPLKERKFIKVDMDNIDTVMNHIKPGIKTRVDNTLTEDEEALAVQLRFTSMQDFEPAAVVEQVPALKELKKVRDALRDLLSKTDRSEALEKILETALQNNTTLEALAVELGLKQP